MIVDQDLRFTHINHLISFVLGVLVIARALNIGDAVAACPDPYDDVADDCYVSSELICQTYGETIECDLNRVAPESGGGGGVGVAVYNDPLSPVCDVAAQYCIFGYDTNAIEFCCEIVASDEEELILKGTPDFNDFLYFNYEWDNTSYNLVPRHRSSE